MSESEDFYALLGVSPAATPDEIAQAYAARITASASDPPLMLRLSTAFQTLLDPARRSEYDTARSPSPVPPQASADPPAAPPPAPPPGPAPTVPPGQWAAPGSPASAGAAGPGPDVTTRVEPPPANGGDRTEIVAWPPAAGPDDLTQRPVAVTCPICGVSNTPAPPPTESYCQDCGFLLSQTPGEGEVVTSGGVRLVSADGTREFVLSPGTSAVGRQDAEVLLVDGTVSRLHARLYLEDGRLSIEDANSTNGSRVNGTRLEPGKRTAVSDGDEVQFGQISLRVRGAAPSGAGPTGTIVESGGRAAVTAPEPSGPELARLVSLPAGTVYPVYSYPAAVGRRADSAIVINDPYISGRHAELIEEDGLIMVHDLGSTNGTVVGSEMLDKGASAPLPPGGIVQFGKQRFRFETAGVDKAVPGEEAGEGVDEAPTPAGEPAAEEVAPVIPAFGRIDDGNIDDSSIGGAPAGNTTDAGGAPAENSKTNESERPAAG